MNDLTITRPSTPRILVVDDDPRFREIIVTYLFVGGYDVIESDSGKAALEKCQEEKLDLVLLDVMMPKKDGFEVCEEIKELDIPGFLPVIMLTAIDDKQAKVKAYEVGADDFINKPVSRTELMIRVKSLLRIRDLSLEMENIGNVLFSLVKILETRDPYTKGHSERVARWTEAVAEQMDFTQQEIKELRKGALLHDIGKISIRSEIILKEDKLSRGEYKRIKRHPVIGQEICNPLYSLKNILPMIRHHHERLDGSGYPDGLQGEEILPAIRIISVVDVYDALISNRPYREALSKKGALKVIDEEVNRGWWDEEVVFYLKQVV